MDCRPVSGAAARGSGERTARRSAAARLAASWAARSAASSSRRAEALVGPVLAEQALRGRPVGRPVAASDDTARTHPAPPGRPMAGPSSQSMPSQCRPSRMSRSYSSVERADIRVLEAQDERAAVAAGEQDVEQRGPRGPDVQRPRRAGRDPAADGHARKCAGGPGLSQPQRRVSTLPSTSVHLRLPMVTVRCLSGAGTRWRRPPGMR